MKQSLVYAVSSTRAFLREFSSPDSLRNINPFESHYLVYSEAEFCPAGVCFHSCKMVTAFCVMIYQLIKKYMSLPWLMLLLSLSAIFVNNLKLIYILRLEDFHSKRIYGKLLKVVNLLAVCLDFFKRMRTNDFVTIFESVLLLHILVSKGESILRIYLEVLGMA